MPVTSRRCPAAGGLRFVQRLIRAAGLELVHVDTRRVRPETADALRRVGAVYLPHRHAVLVADDLDEPAERVALYVVLEHHRLHHDWTGDPGRWQADQDVAGGRALEQLIPPQQAAYAAAVGCDTEQFAAVIGVPAGAVRAIRQQPGPQQPGPQQPMRLEPMRLAGLGTRLRRGSSGRRGRSADGVD